MSFRILHCVTALSLSCLFSSSLFSATSVTPPSQIQPLASSSLILDIADTGQRLVAVGERGHVLVYDNHWQQVITPTSVQLTKVFFINSTLGWAVGHDATILHTQDGGQTWQLQMQSSEVEKPFLDILFLNEREGMAIGAYGLFYRTWDGGVNWRAEFHEELLAEEDVAYLAELKGSDEAAYLDERASLLPHFNRIIALKDGRLILVGELGLVASSDDKGITFTRTSFDYDGSMFNAIEMRDVIYVMGLRGNIFKTDLSLEQWHEIEMPVQSSINGVMAISDETLYLVGNAGVVIQLNSDDTSRIVTRRQGENLVSIAKDNQGNMWLSGSQGLFILKP
ncbi:YCF48-related protein [Shewanella sp. JNE10-2]|uniref:WD40/YVTN/BNR-like repeat-containing protein n=1 Tax=unclassified Shewanella TaxID=196818 RepID=UPI00200633FF|nr:MULTISPECIES: YCF48-related protein [unclassified Shewanella]MCK7629491.1 YCF48-related protein [Shewanella sp. JNE9-1]MCK7644661.1 YCF48-related protein [Shewanella sp. JNE3-1]MCK7652794.1 YCF48-related protein [Shewanella sp. JNE4-1]UPO26496.1 YCF48-related protein [Shewanella sp. JNE10-2]UPO33693.1 YCF48-related protein [Shewanella sp. JNE7]